MREKHYYRKASEIKALAPDRGACLATDMITVDGQKVGFMYREAPYDAVDSGWRFLAGAETQAYLSQEEHIDRYNINTIANDDPDIIPFLDAPVGSAFERDLKSGQFVLTHASRRSTLIHRGS